MILTKTVYYRKKQVSYESLKKHSMLHIKVKCDRCGKIFQSTKYQLVRNGHEYCQTCALHIKESKTLNIGSVYGKLTVVGIGSRTGYSVCQCSCGKTKEINNHNLTSGKTLSCGCLRSENGKRQMQRICEVQTGKNHPNWKGGISSERSRIESTKEYKDFKSFILSRDKVCQKCGTSLNLVIHHICNFQDYPELRIDDSNCICLCNKCHRAFHRIYGLKNTTKEQFDEFMLDDD